MKNHVTKITLLATKLTIAFSFTTLSAYAVVLDDVPDVAYQELKRINYDYERTSNTFGWSVFSASASALKRGDVLWTVANDDWAIRDRRGLISFVDPHNFGQGWQSAEFFGTSRSMSAVGTNKGYIQFVGPVLPSGFYTDGQEIAIARFETSFSDVIRPLGGSGGRFSLGAHADAVLPTWPSSQSYYGFDFGWTVFDSAGVKKQYGDLSGFWTNQGSVSKSENCDTFPQQHCSLTQSLMEPSGFVRSDFNFDVVLSPGDYIRIRSGIRGSIGFLGLGQVPSVSLNALSTSHIDMIQGPPGATLEAASGMLVYEDGAWRYPLPTAAVPEPETYFQFLCGLIGLLGLRQIRKSNKAVKNEFEYI